MSNRTKTTRRRKRRSNYKKSNTLNLYRQPLTVPDSIYVKLKYSDTFGFAGAVGVPAYYSFAGNSIFDPDKSAGGHQPLGRDEWNAFYTKYEVKSLSIKVSFCSSSSSPDAQTVAVCPTDVLAPAGWATSINSMIEAPYCKSTMIPGAANSQGMVKTLGYHMSTKSKFGDSKNKDDLQAQFGADPNELWFHTIGVQSTVGINEGAANLKVDIVYYVRLFDRKDLDGS